MAGPLFRELAEGLSEKMTEGCVLYTGHPDTLALKGKVPEALKIEAAPAYDRTSKFKRLFSWIKYLIASSRYILGSKERDAFVLVSNPPFLGIWFWLLSFIKKRPYILLVYDIHPDALVQMGFLSPNSIIVKIWRWFNAKVYRDAQKVITLGDIMSQRLMMQFVAKPDQVEVIPPWVDVGFIKPVAYEENPLSNEFNPNKKTVVLYSGNMGISHDIDSMLDAALLLRDREDIVFIFIGLGEKWNDAKLFAKKHGLGNVKVFPFQAEDRLPYTITLGAISLVALDQGAEELMVPSKVFYYLAAGSSIIGICQGQNELQNVIDNCECGICIPPKSPNLLAQEIASLVDDRSRLLDFQKNARNAAVKYYSRPIGINKFVSVFRSAGIMKL